MFRNDAHSELLEGNKVKILDPTAKYLVYSESMCAPDLTKLDPVEDDLAPCVLREGFGSGTSEDPSTPNAFGPIRRNRGGVAVPGEPDDPPALLIQEDGGTDLSHLKLTPSQIVPFLEGFARVFEGYAMLLSKGFVHKDCKPLNLVARKEPDQSWLIRIIDFGMLQKISEMTTFLDMPLFYTYPYWTAEFGFLCDGFQVTSRGAQVARAQMLFGLGGKFTKDYITNSFDDFMRPLLVDLWMDADTGRIHSNIVEEITDLVVKLQGASRGDTIQHILKKMDVYSLGYTLGVMLYLSTGFRSGFGGRLEVEVTVENNVRTLGFDPNAASFLLVQEEGETDFQFRQREFYHSLAYSVMFPLFTLVRRMIEPRPSRRISIDVALETYRTILPALRSSVMRNMNAVRVYSTFAKATRMGGPSPRIAQDRAVLTQSLSVLGDGGVRVLSWCLVLVQIWRSLRGELVRRGVAGSVPISATPIPPLSPNYGARGMYVSPVSESPVSESSVSESEPNVEKGISPIPESPLSPFFTIGAADTIESDLAAGLRGAEKIEQAEALRVHTAEIPVPPADWNQFTQNVGLFTLAPNFVQQPEHPIDLLETIRTPSVEALQSLRGPTGIRRRTGPLQTRRVPLPS